MHSFALPALRRGAALAVGGALLIPAAASADAIVSAGPVKVRDYQMTVSAVDGKADSLSVMFHRKDGKASQMHFYSFSTGVSVKVAGNLGSATVKGSLGRFGAVDLKLTGAGALKRFGVPSGCTGKGSKGRAGTLAGSFKLVADSTYFKTISKKSLKGQVLNAGSITCDGTGGGGTGGSGSAGSLTLSAFVDGGAAGMISASATKSARGEVTQQVMRMDAAAATAPTSIMHWISAPAPASTFTAAADLGSATLVGASRFITGRATFASEGGSETTASGTLTGDLVARFDSIGPITIAAGETVATLSKR